jgi:KDO2-lipid IV(A) lauroyltransferase
MQVALYYLFCGCCRLLALLPMRALYLLSDLLFPLVYHVVRYRRKVVANNLRLAFPEKTDKERHCIERRFYRWFCDLMMEIVKMSHAGQAEMARRIKFSNPELLDRLYRKGKHGFVATGHYGNWEWLASLENSHLYHLATLYHPLANRHFDRFFHRLRTRFGTSAIPSQRSMRVIPRIVKGTQPTLICFPADQAPGDHPTNYWRPFLTQDSAIFLGVEKLAKRYNQAALYCEVRRVKRGYYEVEFTLIAENAADTADYEITDRHVALLEEGIRRAPEYWLWTHRRWKRKRHVEPKTPNHDGH